jgi:hypothetical protein
MSRDRYRCQACGEVFPTWAAAERHADAYGHHRVEQLLGRYWPTEKAAALLHPDEVADGHTA